MRWPFKLPRRRRSHHLEGILELFDDLVHVGEIVDGQYRSRFSGPTLARFVGTHVDDPEESGKLWTSCVDPRDREAYEAFVAEVVTAGSGQANYRLRGLDGATRIVWHRARGRPLPGGGVLVQGLVSDVTSREETAAKLAAADDRFTQLLAVIGEHIYSAVVHPDGRFEEVFQGPGADRLLGGALPDPEMKNWMAAIHPEDRAAVDVYEQALAAGDDAEVEYRLRGHDGVTRWVHDRAAAHRRADGAIEISGIVRDVTERRRLRDELARVVEALDDHLYTLGPNRRSIYRGPNLERLTGRPVTDPDRDWEAMVHPDDRLPRRRALTALERGEPVEVEYRVIAAGGVERIVLDRLRPRREADGTLLYDGVISDITQRRALEDELRRAHRASQELAITDELTGAFNRRHFAAIAGEEIAAGDCGLLLLDADHFKRINDVHGHVAGDAVLVELVGRLRGVLIPGDVLARWGGEEFAVLVRGVGSDTELERRALALLDAVATTPVAVRDDLAVPLTVSIGAARGLDSLDALIDLADARLYTAKRDGRNRVSLGERPPGFVLR